MTVGADAHIGPFLKFPYSPKRRKNEMICRRGVEGAAPYAYEAGLF